MSKKTEKMHLRLTEDIAREVRAVADLEHRAIQDQLRFLIVLGLQAARSGVHGNAGADGRTMTHDAAQVVLPAPPMVASGRTAPHKRRIA
jgi:hypothetical protein